MPSPCSSSPQWPKHSPWETAHSRDSRPTTTCRQAHDTTSPLFFLTGYPLALAACCALVLAATALAAELRGLPRWEPVDGNYRIAARMDVSESTARRAKVLLAAHGAIMKDTTSA